MGWKNIHYTYYVFYFVIGPKVLVHFNSLKIVQSEIYETSWTKELNYTCEDLFQYHLDT